VRIKTFSRRLDLRHDGCDMWEKDTDFVNEWIIVARWQSDISELLSGAEWGARQLWRKLFSGDKIPLIADEGQEYQKQLQIVSNSSWNRIQKRLRDDSCRFFFARHSTADFHLDPNPCCTTFGERF
jgi:hypothetical protein